MKTSRLAVTANPCGSPHDRVFAYPPHARTRHFVPRRAVAKILAIAMGISAMGASLNASSVNLAWNANPEENVVGYRLSYGTSQGNHPIIQEVGKVTSTTVRDLVKGQTYYFVLRAVAADGLVSEPSDEIAYQVPVPDYVSPKGWRLHYVSSHQPPMYDAIHAFDGDPNTFWLDHAAPPPSPEVLLGLEEGSGSRGQANSLDSIVFTAESTYTARELGARFVSVPATVRLRMAIYSGTGATAELLGFTAAMTPEAGVNYLALNQGAAIVAGQTYMISAWVSRGVGENLVWSANDGVGTRLRRDIPLNETGSFPSPYGTVSETTATTYAVWASEKSTLDPPPVNEPPPAVLLGLQEGSGIRGQANSLDSIVFTAESTYTARELGARFVSVPATVRLRMAIYSGTGATAELLGFTAAMTPNAGENYLTLNQGVAIVAGQTYMISAWVSRGVGENLVWSANDGVGTRLRRDVPLNETGSFPSPYGTVSETTATTYAVWASVKATVDPPPGSEPPHEIQIDLGKEEVIEGFTYLPRQDGSTVGDIADFEFYISMDGVNWGSPAASGTFAGTKSEKEVLFPVTNGRYIMLRQLTEAGGGNHCAVAEINLIVGGGDGGGEPENRAPEASASSIATHQDTSVAITLVASDPDGDPLTYQIVSQPSKGTLSGTAPDLTYTPHAGATGPDSFTFRASDGQLNSNTATVSITISQPEPVTTLISRSGWRLHYVDSEEPPTHAATNAFDGNPSSFWHTAYRNGSSPPPHEIQIDLGKLEVIAGFRYLPRQDAYNVGNIADFEFYVSMDGANWGSPVAEGTFINNKTEKEVRFSSVEARYIMLRQLTEVNGLDDCAVAEINLIAGDAAQIALPANRAPIASSSSVATDEDTAVAITLVASDPDGDPLTYEIISHPAMGTLSGTAPNLTYTPDDDVNGSDSFSFRVSDGQLTSGTATVSITIRPVNDAPVAESQSVTTAEDTPVGIMLYATDVDGDPLTYRIVTPPANGRLTGSAPNLIYTPKPQYHGSDFITFVANDGTVDSSTATVSITVTAVNYPPVAIARMISTPADTPMLITLTATDRNGDELTYRITRPPMKGRLSGTPPTLTYTPNPRVSGSDSFTFVANDGIVDSNTATIFINLTEPQQKNRPPVFSEEKLGRSPGTSGEEYSCLSLEGAAIDPDGDIVAYEKVDGPEWLVIFHNGEIAGTPPAEAAGLNAFVIRARDPEGAYAETLLEIHIEDTDLPLPWTMDRIGTAGEESTARGDHDSLTLTGSGALAGRSDSGLLVWQTLTGDGDIIARIDSIVDAGPSSRIGLMIRESLSSDSKHTFIGMDGRGFVRWVRRTRTGGNTSISSVASTNPVGVWLRLTRDGNTISAFTSDNGSDWTGVATTSIDLGSSSYIGPMVASGGETPVTAVFDNVTVTP